MASVNSCVNLRGLKNHISSIISTSSRALSFLLGLLGFAFISITIIFNSNINDALNQVLKTLGPIFLILLLGLVFVSIYCWLKQVEFAREQYKRQVWSEAALQSADSISTLALTCTLLGISLGIGTLAEEQLTPDTVQAVVKNLTKHFSLAFMTTVVGLPCSAILRSLIQITEAKFETQNTHIAEQGREKSYEIPTV